LPQEIAPTPQHDMTEKLLEPSFTVQCQAIPSSYGCELEREIS
jgi:hypothetical protein